MVDRHQVSSDRNECLIRIYNDCKSDCKIECKIDLKSDKFYILETIHQIINRHRRSNIFRYLVVVCLLMSLVVLLLIAVGVIQIIDVKAIASVVLCTVWLLGILFGYILSDDVYEREEYAVEFAYQLSIEIDRYNKWVSKFVADRNCMVELLKENGIEIE